MGGAWWWGAALAAVMPARGTGSSYRIWPCGSLPCGVLGWGPPSLKLPVQDKWPAPQEGPTVAPFCSSQPSKCLSLRRLWDRLKGSSTGQGDPKA